MLTVYLFRTVLFSKPSNVHLFLPAFWFGSLHIDFPVRWHAPIKLGNSGVLSIWVPAREPALEASSVPTPHLTGWERAGLTVWTTIAIPLSVLCGFPLSQQGWPFILMFTHKSPSKSSIFLLSFIRKCSRQGCSRKQNPSLMICPGVGNFFFFKGPDNNVFGFVGHISLCRNWPQTAPKWWMIGVAEFHSVRLSLWKETRVGIFGLWGRVCWPLVKWTSFKGPCTDIWTRSKEQTRGTEVPRHYSSRRLMGQEEEVLWICPSENGALGGTRAVREQGRNTSTSFSSSPPSDHLLVRTIIWSNQGPANKGPGDEVPTGQHLWGENWSRRRQAQTKGEWAVWAMSVWGLTS